MKRRIALIYVINNLFFLFSILLSFQLWLNHRDFPFIPVREGLPILSSPLDFMILLVLLGLLLGSMVIASRFLKYAILILLLALVFQDQMRWQPWVYHFFLFFLPFCLFDLKKQQNPLPYFQLILMGVYLWGGLHKLNPNFIQHVFPVFAEAVLGPLPKGYLNVGYLIPFTEILIAIGLFFRKTRNLAVWLGLLTHLSILSWLTPAAGNSNWVILPWNVAMILFLFLGFYGNLEQERLFNFRYGLFEYFKVLILFPAFLLPLLNFWGGWDHYLSFNLYSGKNKLLYIAIEESALKKVDYKLNPTFVELPGLEGGKIVDANKWSFQTLHVPIPPEERIFKAIARQFCKQDIAVAHIVFLKVEQPISAGNYTSFTCDTMN